MEKAKELLALDIDMFTVAQCAIIKNVCVHSIRGAIRNGILKAVKVGTIWIIMREDILNYYPNASKKYKRKQVKYRGKIIL